MLNNYITLAIQSNKECHLPPQDHMQLKSFLTLLEAHNITTLKKRKVSDTAILMDAEFSQTIASTLESFL